MFGIVAFVTTRAAMKDLETLQSEENAWRRERMEFERSMALAKHEMKEVRLERTLDKCLYMYKTLY